jgi:hypothetical protein
MVKDFLLDLNGDILIEGGDFVIGDSDDQHNETILVAPKGLVRWSLISGVGILRYVKSRFGIKEIDALRQETQLQLQIDGVASPEIIINSSTDITINGNR